MVLRFLTAVALGLLVMAWLAVGVVSLLRIQRAGAIAQSVQTGTVSVQRILEEPPAAWEEPEKFPANRVVSAISEAWARAAAVSSYPVEILASSAPAAGTVTTTTTTPSRPAPAAPAAPAAPRRRTP